LKRTALPPADRPPEWQFHIFGDALCLDFANTVSWRRSPAPIERLAGYGDLVSWARQIGLVSPAEATRLTREAAKNPGQAARRLAAARELRELIFGVFAATSEGRRPDDRVVDKLNVWIRSAFANSRLVSAGDSYQWRSLARGPRIEQVAQEIARSAADLLTSERLSRVGQCNGRDCRWLFIDRTRNRSRRWCAMAVCGNRAKAQRHYHQFHARRR